MIYPPDTELDEVLSPLTGVGMYRNNAFRLAGLPTTASAKQIRRRHEEASLAAEMGTPVPALAGELPPLPLAPPPDAETVRSACESLRNPVLRLVHEMLWLWGEDGPHDESVRAHCALLDHESTAGPGQLAAESADAIARDWADALKGWADVLSAEETWDHARDRVRETDDPRLTIGTMRRLRDRLPAHLVTVSVRLAVRAAEAVRSNDTSWAADAVAGELADRYIELLDESPFDDELIDWALREAVRPAEDQLRSGCENATTVANTAPDKAIDAGHALLRQAGPQLRVITALLGSDDPVSTAVRDEVAKAVNLCAVANHRHTSDGGLAMTLLPAALDLAAEHMTVELIESNLRIIGQDRVINSVADLVAASKLDAAGDRLRAWGQRTTDPTLRDQIENVLNDPTALLRPPNGSAPSRTMVFGIGTAWVGRRALRGDGKYIATHVFAIFFLLIPMAAYLRDSMYIYGKVPLSGAARWWRRVALIITPGLVMWIFGGFQTGLWTAAALAVLGAITLGIRQRQVAAWVAARTGAEAQGRINRA